MENDRLQDLLSRVDERTKQIRDDLTRLDQTLQADRKAVEEKFKQADKARDDFKEWIQEQFIRKESFSPVQKIVYGLVTLILTGFAGALVSLVYGNR